MRKTLSILCITAAAGGVLAGCGSSGKSVSTAAGVVTAPSGGATAAAATPAAPASTSSSTTSASTSSSNVKLPAALSTEPTIKSPGGKPPRTLIVKNLIVGTGPAVTSASQTVTIAYVGALYSNGKVFDASWKDVPTTHTISQPASGFVPGFKKGLLGMKVGGRREFIIPPSLAYKSKKSGPIPANSTLIFIVDLHAVS